MPKYELPPVVDNDEGLVDVPPTRAGYQYPDQWARRISIPVNKEILSALTIGGRVSITLEGKVQEMTDNQSAGEAGRTEIVMVVESVDAYPDNQSQEEKDFESGFGEPRRIGFRKYF